ncbi:MAG: phosphate/phosphite/phosphonate ABC transporter substrate-binding protein [Desulfobacteraceae bacterium]|nr:phosphate/phosphite/phosphonate ABC transporter substrate-binding protein [Desulfobacteraceae bacterium]
MKKMLFFATIFVVLAFSISMAQADKTYKIGVLAKNGPEKALRMWKATGEYLTSKINGMSFEIVPLKFTEVNQAIKSKKVDFFLVNSSMFVTAKVKYGASAIATMINSRQGKPLKSFGGVVITNANNQKVNQIGDLKGKSFMAVAKSSFGGWQMAYKELLEAGINPEVDFKKLEFGGKHDDVVYAVMNGTVEAGTVRTDTLERLVTENAIDINKLKILNAKSHSNFPFKCSTPLYPEWPLAKVSGTPNNVVTAVVSALKAVKPADDAAKSAKVLGWVDALDYTPVEKLQKALKVGAFSSAGS